VTNEERDQLIRSTHDTVIALNERVKNHADNEVIHHIPPCAHGAGLSVKLWGVLIGTLFAIGGTLFSLLRGN